MFETVVELDGLTNAADRAFGTVKPATRVDVASSISATDASKFNRGLAKRRLLSRLNRDVAWETKGVGDWRHERRDGRKTPQPLMVRKGDAVTVSVQFAAACTRAGHAIQGKLTRE